MRVKDYGDSITLWISARETSDWARRWPCSSLAGKRIVVSYDARGLVDLTINGRAPRDDIDAWELNALVADHAAARINRYHDCRCVIVGQFVGED